MAFKNDVLKKFFFEVRDQLDNKVVSGLCVKLIIPNTGAAATSVYADARETAHAYISSGMLSSGDFDTLEGTVEFWSGYGSVDVLVLNDQMEGMLVKGMKPSSPGRILWNPGDIRKYVVDFFDDFDHGYVTADRWTLATDGGGTMTIDDAVDGIGLLLTGGTDEDGSTITSTDEIFLAQTDKNIYFEARVKLTEANTNAANIFVGLADIATVDLMQDSGAGPAATLDGIGFYKLDKLAGNMFWEFQASNAGTKDDNSDMVAYVSGTWYTLSFVYDYNDGTTAKITPSVNGVAYDPVDLTISGMAEMGAALSVKTGSTNAETLLVDYVRVSAERNW